jgi:thiamine biosynthesis protein ThiS
MNISLNGQPYDTDAVHLGALAEERDARRAGIAIALNGKVVRSIAWDETTIHDGDAIEIVTAAAGG